MIYGLLLICCLFLLINLLVLGVLIVAKNKLKEPAEWPGVSVWIAARNEAGNIMRCLESLNRLDYPQDRLEILIGNDKSSDETKNLAEAYITDKAHFRLFNIHKNKGKARGKANVLAHLAHQSTKEYYAITDADIAVDPQWLKQLVSAFEPGVGIVNGTTVIRQSTLFSKMQHQDWLFFMGILKAFADLGKPATAVGNNMCISKEAYWSTGGYENIPFSITEDFKLFDEAVKKGWKLKHLLTSGSTNVSEPAATLKAFMQQRKRWLTGGEELSLFWKFLLTVFGAFFPVVIILLFLNWQWALFLWASKFLLQTLCLLVLSVRTGQPVNLGNLVIYEFYSFFISLLTPVYLMLPGGKVWKERKF